jgi:hypothetical protein
MPNPSFGCSGQEYSDFMEASVTGTHGQWTRTHMEITRMGKPHSLNAIADKIETKVGFELLGIMASIFTGLVKM